MLSMRCNLYGLKRVKETGVYLFEAAAWFSNVKMDKLVIFKPERS